MQSSFEFGDNREGGGERGDSRFDRGESGNSALRRSKAKMRDADTREVTQNASCKIVLPV